MKPADIETWLKFLQRWSGPAGKALFLGWIGFLLLLSLFQSPQEMHAPSAPVRGPSGQDAGCVEMSDGTKVCNALGAVEVLCAFVPSPSSTRRPKLSAPADSALEAVKLVASVAGISPRFEIFQGDSVPGVAFAAIDGKKRIIVYDAKAFHWEPRVIRWRALSIIAHEIGHHEGAHFLGAGTAHERELEADRFGGYALALLGANREQALSFTSEFPESDSDTHPGRAKRIAAITDGWEHGQRVKRGSL